MSQLRDAKPISQDLADVFRGDAEAGYSLKDPNSGKGISVTSIPAFVAGEELAALADDDHRIVVLTADLAFANRTMDFAARHPDRFFNVGVAEQNMISIAAGLASAGMLPFAATFASYVALTGCEQIRTDLAYTGMPVRLLGHHSGMSLGFYGTSHHALEDIAMMRAIADLTVVCAADSNQLRAILRASLDHPGAMYIRLGRGRDPEVYSEVPADFEIGRATRLRDGDAATIITTGSELWACLGQRNASPPTTSRSASSTCTRSARSIPRKCSTPVGTPLSSSPSKSTTAAGVSAPPSPRPSWTTARTHGSIASPSPTSTSSSDHPLRCMRTTGSMPMAWSSHCVSCSDHEQELR